MVRFVHMVVVAFVTFAAAVAPLGSPARAAPDFTSFFAGQPDLEGAGWAACESPLTWSVDTRGLGDSVARSEIRRLKAAWQEWSEASGIKVRFVGSERLDFDPGTNGLRRADGVSIPDRHVYIAFKTRRQVPIMTRGVVGLAMPSVVLLPTREIVGGMTIVRRSYVLDERARRPLHLNHLYLHEIGHILGLGHARAMTNVMYPSMDTMDSLGRGDRAGIRSITQLCVR